MTEKKSLNPSIDNFNKNLGQPNPLSNLKSFSDMTQKPALLLHSCCGPCSTAVIERLIEEFQITVFFYNPCITNPEEYQKRKETQILFIKQYNESLPPKDKISFKEGHYEPKAFYKLVSGLEDQPEGGRRCQICFLQRLEKTVEYAKLLAYDYFATTLTVSPHKNYEIITGIGKRLGIKYGLTFLDRDFKKKNGFKRSVVLSKEYQLYRQNYCGCEYSNWEGDR
ncbi:MAG: epoxyqueuosine reductase QueH [Anaerovoracaceae bacterium]